MFLTPIRGRALTKRISELSSKWLKEVLVTVCDANSGKVFQTLSRMEGFLSSVTSPRPLAVSPDFATLAL